jgi:hypothetical protein
MFTVPSFHVPFLTKWFMNKKLCKPPIGLLACKLAAWIHICEIPPVPSPLPPPFLGLLIISLMNVSRALGPLPLNLLLFLSTCPCFPSCLPKSFPSFRPSLTPFLLTYFRSLLFFPPSYFSFSYFFSPVSFSFLLFILFLSLIFLPFVFFVSLFSVSVSVFLSLYLSTCVSLSCLSYLSVSVSLSPTHSLPHSRFFFLTKRLFPPAVGSLCLISSPHI